MVSEKWAPIIQQGIKSGVVLILCLIFVPQIISILTIVQDRMLSGSSFSIGPEGISLGEAPKIPDNKPMPADFPSPRGLVEGSPVKGMPSGPLTRGLSPAVNSSSLKDMFYIVHAAKRSDVDQYDVVVRIGSHNSLAFQYVDRVVYHLHESFKDSVRDMSNSQSNYELTLEAWGQFEIKADVYLKESSTPIRLSRFLNF